MHYEYAVEPSLLSNWKDFRFYVSNFGWEHGRLIARYPKKWKRLVYESLGNISDGEKKKIEEALTRIDERLLPRKSEWDPQLSDWLQNAEREHESRPFRAIIAVANPRAHSQVLLESAIDDTLDYETLPGDDSRRLWCSCRSAVVRRSATEMANEVGVLLSQCKEVLFVDKHFGPENVRHRRPLQEFMKLIASRETGTLPDRVEVHTGDTLSLEALQEFCERSLVATIPCGLSLHIVQRRRGELHNRFILTDCGGVAFLEGLDEKSSSGRSEDIVVLLDKKLAFQLLQDYEWRGNAPKYTVVDHLSLP